MEKKKPPTLWSVYKEDIILMVTVAAIGCAVHASISYALLYFIVYK